MRNSVCTECWVPLRLGPRPQEHGQLPLPRGPLVALSWDPTQGLEVGRWSGEAPQDGAGLSWTRR